MPLLWLSLALIGGILLAERLHAAALALPVFAWLLLAGAALLLAVLLRLARRSNPAFWPRLSPFHLVAAAFVFGGAARYQASLPELKPGGIAWYNDLETPVVIEGVLVQPPDERDSYTNLRLEVEQLHLQGQALFQPAHGLLLARVPSTGGPSGGWRYGDRLRLEGQLQTPPVDESFSYRDYLARQEIYSYMPRAEALVLRREQGSPLWAALYAFKDLALRTVYRLYPDPEASLLAGILLGVENGIPQAVQDAFTATGTSHIIAISGFNIAIIAGLISGSLGRMIGPRRAFLPTVGVIALYTLLVGGSASVVRAAIMGCLGLLAREVGRRQNALNSLGLAAGLMCLANPFTPWDAGFQLSFAATLGLILYADPITQFVQRILIRRTSPARAQRITAALADTFLLTLAAQLFTLPVIVYHFQRLSLSALIVNPLVLPAQPAIMILGGLSLLAGMLWPAAGQLLALSAWPLVVYTIRVIETLARLPGGNLLLGELALPLVIVIYAVLLLAATGGPRLQAARAALKPAGVLTALLLAAALAWRAAWAAPDGRLHITLLNVGEASARAGDALLIRTPGGRSLLVNGGPSLTRLSDALGRRLPAAPGGPPLDWLVVTAPGDEHLMAASRLLERFPAANVLWAGGTHGTRAARDLQAVLVQQGTPQTLARPGHTLDLGSGARLQALSVGARGGVFLLEWGRFRLVLSSGMDFDQLEALRSGAEIGPVSALLLADGGYAPLNPPAWIANLRPQVVLISVSTASREALPSPETLTALQGYNVLRTDQRGWIELITDGERLWVEAEKPGPQP